ncbi:MAG: baseplate J/gp47 family protein, partial [Anaerolineales bacterium]
FIPVFETISRAQRNPWRRGRRKKFVFRPHVARIEKILSDRQKRKKDWTANHRQKTRFVVFGIAILAVFMLISMFFLPSAEIVLPISEKEQSLSLSISAGTRFSGISLSGNIPASEHATIVEGREQIPSSGKQTYPGSIAAGEIVVTNLTEQEVIVPSGTVVTTLSEPVVRFQTEREVRVPAGNGQSASVAVRALLPGSLGNVVAGQIVAIEGEIGLLVRVNNPQPTQGGEDFFAAMPTNEDYQNLRKKLLSTLEQAAIREFTESLSGRYVLPATLRLKEVLEETREPLEGQPGDYLSLKMRAEYTIWSVSRKDIEEVARLSLDANLPDNYQPVQNSLIVTSLSEPVLADHTVHWDIFAVRRVRGSFSSEELRSMLAGAKRESALSLLQNRVPTDYSPDIILHPAWWTRLPYLPGRIEFEVQ